MGPRLGLTRTQILAYRRRAGGLDRRQPLEEETLRRAAWAGLQDSVPRAALLSIHARVAGAEPSSWEHPSLVQLWGPRFSAYVVAAADVAVFSLGRLPDDASRRQLAEDLADRLEAFLGGRRLPYGEAGHALGVHPNMLRYAAPTGRVLIRWDGARQPTIRTIPRPAVEPREARLELARRFLHILGPAAAPAFGRWAGIGPPRARAVFDALCDELAPVRTPGGDAWILAADEAAFLAPASDAGGARFLPSGDAYTLLQAADRELLVPEAEPRRALWTPPVQPGALLVGAELAGTWRRADASLTIEPWRRLSPQERDAVEAEAQSLPLPGIRAPIRVAWAA